MYVDSYIEEKYPNPAENRYYTCLECGEEFIESYDPEREICTKCFVKEQEG